MENFINFLYNKNPLLILSYLSKNIYKENTASNISKELKLSIGSVHGILKKFEQEGIVVSRLLGKSVIYELDTNNSLLKPFRIFDNINDIFPLVKQMKLLSRKIILFGSCAKGEDSIDSDIDLFVLTDEEKEKINQIIDEAKLDRQINPVILSTIEYMDFENNEKVFFNEIMKGITLWEV